jgi:glycosyltransferase involved in cell wall biosynthesis
LSKVLGIGARSRFPGFVPAEDDLPGLYRLASVFAIASDLETQGVVVLEAMASGLPVVAVRAGAVPDAVQDGVGGYLVGPGDVDAMAARLVTLLRDPSLACRLGRAGRVTAEGHSFSGAVAAYERLYRGLVASHGNPARQAECEGDPLSQERRVLRNCYARGDRSSGQDGRSRGQPA